VEIPPAQKCFIKYCPKGLFNQPTKVDLRLLSNATIHQEAGACHHVYFNLQHADWNSLECIPKWDIILS